MVRVLIRVLISLWSTKPVFPSPTRHWYLDVLSKLNMSKAKDTPSRTKLFIFLHPFIFLQSTPFLVLPFSVMGIPTHPIYPPGQLRLSFPLCQVPTPGIRRLPLTWGSLSPPLHLELTILCLYFLSSVTLQLLSHWSSCLQFGPLQPITFLNFKSHPILTPHFLQIWKTLHGFWHKCSFFLLCKLQEVSATYLITHYSHTW